MFFYELNAIMGVGKVQWLLHVLPVLTLKFLILPTVNYSVFVMVMECFV